MAINEHEWPSMQLMAINEQVLGHTVRRASLWYSYDRNAVAFVLKIEVSS